MADQGMIEGTAKPALDSQTAPSRKMFGGLAKPTVNEGTVDPFLMDMSRITPEAKADYDQLGADADLLREQLRELLETEAPEPGWYTKHVLRGLGIDWRAQNLQRKVGIADVITGTIAQVEQQRRLYTTPDQSQLKARMMLLEKYDQNATYEQQRDMLMRFDPRSPGVDSYRWRAVVEGGATDMKTTDVLKEPSREAQDAALTNIMNIADRTGKWIKENENIPQNLKEEVGSYVGGQLAAASGYAQNQIDLTSSLTGLRSTTGELGTVLNTHADPELPGNIRFEDGKELNEYFHNKSLEEFGAIIGRPLSFSKTEGMISTRDVLRMSEVRSLEEDRALYPEEWLTAMNGVYKNLIDKGGNAGAIILGQHPFLNMFRTTGDVPVELIERQMAALERGEEPEEAPSEE